MSNRHKHLYIYIIHRYDNVRLRPSSTCSEIYLITHFHVINIHADASESAKTGIANVVKCIWYDHWSWHLQTVRHNTRTCFAHAQQNALPHIIVERHEYCQNPPGPSKCVRQCLRRRRRKHYVWSPLKVTGGFRPKWVLKHELVLLVYAFIRAKYTTGLKWQCEIFDR